MAQLSYADRVVAPEGILFRELDGESVLLNLNTGNYFGLDEVGTRMWVTLTGTGSIQAAYEGLLDEYDVESRELRQDLEELIEKLTGHGLLAVVAG